MSTHKHIDKICCVVLAFTLVLTVVFMNAEKFGVQKTAAAMEYENTLFDTSKVHTIDIVMDDWDDFLESCTTEEYYACTVVIDQKAFKNVAIRGKGNTSLTQVKAYGNDRYSFKIEFDHYDSTNTYYGLDKLCLNNIIQDNTYMKDYLTYQMMNEMGVASPLCSYAYITVNGEDWGLYLAVEGVEESFLKRNYGNDYGELYKPDSIKMGGGRGNGEKFDIEDFLDESDYENIMDHSGGTFLQMPPEGMQGENMTPPEGTQGENMTPPEGTQGENMTPPEGMQGENMTPPEGMQNGDMMPQGETPGGNMKPPGNAQGGNAQVGNAQGGNAQVGNAQTGNKPSPDNDRGMNYGNEDVLLKYIDDEFESYSNIFNNAKTNVTNADKTRLIAALKKLSNGEELESTVDVSSVIRYFVVHNYVCNFDSYTGSMIHNYYLYEEDGQMQMIPWDYNLAFGGFQSAGNATSLVNYPIDSPVSGGNVEDRPMIAWIFENEEYLELYHQYFSEFLAGYFDNGYFEEMMDSVETMIAPYVQKDPTKFCTYEEFEKGVSTLREFCLLRAESIRGQLDGTIGSTSDTQESSTLIDAGNLQINDMGSMESGGRMSKPGKMHN